MKKNDPSRCSLDGAPRIALNPEQTKFGACSLVNGKDGTGGCVDPLHDFNKEKEVTNKRETRDEARQRIGIALQAEIEDMRKNGLTDILLGLKVYAALVDARYELEQLKTRLAFELHLNNKFIRHNA